MSRYHIPVLGRKTPILYFTRIVPVADDGAIAKTAEWSKDCIFRRAIPFAVAIEVQEPFSGAWSKDSDFVIASTVPVADYR